MDITTGNLNVKNNFLMTESETAIGKRFIYKIVKELYT
jgi:hypothetical protein